MKKLTKQFLVSVYDDGSVRITERALTKRDAHGRYTSTRKPWHGGEVVCPNCGVHLYF